jgi:hypothetical protein
MPEDLDELLRDYASRWRAGLDETPVHEAVRPRRWPALLAAAAVVLVVAVAAVLASSHDATAPPSPTGHGGVVPWEPLMPTSPHIPSHRTPPSPDPTVPVDAPICQREQLRPSTSMGAAMGTDYLTVTLHLRGSTPCRLQGYPTVQPLTNGNPVDVPQRREPSLTGWPGGAVAVRVGEPALIQVSWAASYCGPELDVDQLRITFPPAQWSFSVPGFGTTTCDPAEPGHPPMAVHPVQPMHFRHGWVTTAYSTVHATGPPQLVAAAGSRSSFVVTLTARHRVVLDPCPDYLVETSSGKQVGSTSYALDCAALPYRDAQGRPYLPAGKPIRFAMQLTVPANAVTGFGKWSWTMLAPGNGPTVGGTLVVRPPT